MGAPKGFVGRARRAALLFRPGLSWPTNNGTPLRCPHPVRSKSLVTVTATLALVGFLAVLAGAAASPVSGASAGRSATGLEGPSYLPAMSTSSTLGWSLAPNLPAGFRTEALSCVPAFCLAVGSSGQTEVLRTGSRSWTKVAGSPVALSWAEQYATGALRPGRLLFLVHRARPAPLWTVRASSLTVRRLPPGVTQNKRHQERTPRLLRPDEGLP